MHWNVTLCLLLETAPCCCCCVNKKELDIKAGLCFWSPTRSLYHVRKSSLGCLIWILCTSSVLKSVLCRTDYMLICCVRALPLWKSGLYTNTHKRNQKETVYGCVICCMCIDVHWLFLLLSYPSLYSFSYCSFLCTFACVDGLRDWVRLLFGRNYSNNILVVLFISGSLFLNKIPKINPVVTHIVPVTPHIDS